MVLIEGNLSSEQLQFFDSNGYLVLESFASQEEIQSMRKRMEELLDEFDCSSDTSVFSTKNQVKIQFLCSVVWFFQFISLVYLVLREPFFVFFDFVCVLWHLGFSNKRLMITSLKVLRRFHSSGKVCLCLISYLFFLVLSFVFLLISSSCLCLCKE